MKDESVTDRAAQPLRRIGATSPQANRYVLDAGHGKAVLAAYQTCSNAGIVVRLKSGQVFCHAPGPYPGRGRPAKHGKRFKLAAEVAEPDEQTTIDVKGKTLRIRLWRDLYASYSDVEGIVRLEFLDKAGTPVFAQPIWLFATASDAASEPLARAYLWRSSHELSLFVKQHLGLNKLKSPDLTCCVNWYRLVALAMTLLLVLRDQLQSQPPPWYPRAATKSMSQRQAQKQALSVFLKLPKPTRAPRPAGNAAGRATGYRPPPRTRHPVRKTPIRPKACPTCPFKAAA